MTLYELLLRRSYYIIIGPKDYYIFKDGSSNNIMVVMYAYKKQEIEYF